MTLGLPLRSSHFVALGGTCSIYLYAKTAEKADFAIGLAQTEINRIERRYSRYRSDSILSEINRAAASGGAVQVDDETLALFHYASACHDKSGGLFDITSGVFRRAWKFESSSVPCADQIEKLLPLVGMDNIRIESASVSFAKTGMEVDFGGIGKEYAADRAAAVCLEEGIFHGVVDLGGDVRIIGPHPDGAPWEIGIRNPFVPEGILGHVFMTEGALATSGDYERRIKVGQETYSHLINPKTGWPVEGLASVSVAADHCLAAGSLSTVAMLRGSDGPGWLSGLNPDLRFAWVDREGVFGGSLAEGFRLSSNDDRERRA